MSTTPKAIVKKFYESDFVNNSNLVEEFFHPEVSLIWNRTDGVSNLDFDALISLFAEIRRTYSDLRIDISHLLPHKNFVTVRYCAVRVLDDEEEVGIAHFIAIWEIKDGKIYKGFQVSQPISEMDEVKDRYEAVMI